MEKWACINKLALVYNIKPCIYDGDDAMLYTA